MDLKRPEIDVVVFDIGNVLATYEPRLHLAQRYPPETVEALIEGIFASAHWPEVDRGVRPVADILEDIKQDSPGIAPLVEDVVWNQYPTWTACKEDTIAYLPRLRAAGYRIFLLSNYNADFFETQPHYDVFLKEVEGVVLSGNEKCLKPHPEIYQILLERHHIAPEKAVFYDDLPENVEGARRQGMHAVVFRDAAQLEPLLRPDLSLEEA